MNITDVVNDIKLTQGLNAIALPFDKPVEVVIQEILRTSVRTFSQFKPQIKQQYIAKKDLISPNEYTKNSNIYIVPPEMATTHVQYADISATSASSQTERSFTNVFTVGTPFVGFGSYYPQDILNAVVTGAAINKFAGVTSQTPSSKWLGNNKIQLFDFPEECVVLVTVKCDHEPNLETIPDSCYESFVQLATLDVQRTLYNHLKNMNNVGSAFKEIQLKIDEWSGAEAARKELVENWTRTFHLDDPDLLQFF